MNDLNSDICNKNEDRQILSVVAFPVAIGKSLSFDWLAISDMKMQIEFIPRYVEKSRRTGIFERQKLASKNVWWFFSSNGLLFG